MVHTALGEIMSTNTDKSKNERDLGYGYLVVWLIYALIGIFGSLGLLGKKSNDEKNPIIYSFFEKTDVIPFLVATSFAVHLVTVQPFFCYISKS